MRSAPSEKTKRVLYYLPYVQYLYTNARMVEAAYNRSRASAFHSGVARSGALRARSGVRVGDELDALELVIASPEAHQVHQALRVEARATTQVAVHAQTAAPFRVHCALALGTLCRDRMKNVSWESMWNVDNKEQGDEGKEAHLFVGVELDVFGEQMRPHVAEEQLVLLRVHHSVQQLKRCIHTE